MPSLTDDDRLVIQYLQNQGVQVEPLVWDSSPQRRRDFAGIVIRSCWDYHLKPQQFLHWLGQTVEQGIPLWNSARVVAWNLDKDYLRYLGEKGVPIPPTVWLEKNAKADLPAILGDQGWDNAVVKPTISATAFQTWITSPAQASSDQPKLEQMLARSGVMVQRFVEEIQTRGEWSFIFFLKKYSHAVLKRAKPGDFRVQNDFGGYLDVISPSASLIEQCQGIVDLIEEQLLFARVDGIEIDGKFQLMELELIEPLLFLGRDPMAPQRFSEAILSVLEQ
ncbi:MAG: hypothetical protein H7Z74_16455 [Anaerolineae bacterium]|nr:hypothetical protein [Gemmatimonadaceae bacterium]